MIADRMRELPHADFSELLRSAMREQSGSPAPPRRGARVRRRMPPPADLRGLMADERDPNLPERPRPGTYRRSRLLAKRPLDGPGIHPGRFARDPRGGNRPGARRAVQIGRGGRARRGRLLGISERAADETVLVTPESIDAEREEARGPSGSAAPSSSGGPPTSTSTRTPTPPTRGSSSSSLRTRRGSSGSSQTRGPSRRSTCGPA